MTNLIAILLLALTFCLPAVAGERCDGSPEEVAKMEAKYAEKAWLGVEYDKTDSGHFGYFVSASIAPFTSYGR